MSATSPRAPLRALLAALVIAVVAPIGCGHSSEPGRGVGAASSSTAATTVSLVGDATRGKDLIRQFECTRCHAVANVEDPPKDKQCAGCHADINAGRVAATPEQKARWEAKVAELGDVPSLVATGGRFRRAWVEGFLLHPHDLRPALQPTMPRLSLTEQQAADIATYLSPADDAQLEDAKAVLAGADPARGRELLDVKGCGLCHRMTGVAPLQGALLPAGVVVSDLARAVRLAPDLRVTRDRWRPSLLVRWLVDPAAVKPDTPMPKMGLSEGDARSIAAYLLSARLDPPESRRVPDRLPVLARKVTYDEVATRVLRKTCWHCHGEPDFERGDGGPGNSGGFGFKGRGLNLSEYAATFAGFRDDSGKRTSVFAPTRDGTPWIVAAMLARQREEAGEELDVRGMPLGLPALGAEEIQLVETWIAQGRPR
jgi:cytochrome c2